MKRNVTMDEISDGRLYQAEDMVRTGCQGCGECCQGMGTSIILDPLDIYRLEKYLCMNFEELMREKIELNVVDGIVLPNLKMNGPRERCGFLSEENRCQIHEARPGICRMFPLGRYYEEKGFRYFLQVHECANPKRSKVKVKKWLDMEHLKDYEAYIQQWHEFLKHMEERLKQEGAKEELHKKVSLWILQVFYAVPYDFERDFYEQFYERLAAADKEFN